MERVLIFNNGKKENGVIGEGKSEWKEREGTGGSIIVWVIRT